MRLCMCGLGLWWRTPAAPAADVTNGLTLWLDASDSNTVLRSGSSVTNWQDKSGAGHHFTQANASFQPAFFGGAAPNGAAVVRFSGPSQQCLSNPSDLDATYVNVASYTAVAVFRADQLGTMSPFSYNNTGIAGDDAGYWGIHLRGPASAGRVLNYHWDTTAKQVGSPATTNVFMGFASWVTNNGLYGRVFGGTTNVRTPIGGLNSGAGRLYVGRGYSANFFSGDLAELRLYNRTLSATELADVESFLVSKWSLPPPPAINIGLPPVTNGLTLFLDASDTSVVFRSGASVTDWADKSGAEHVLSANPGLPDYATNATPNGKAAVRLDGVNDALVGSESKLSGLVLETNYTVFAVFRANAIDTSSGTSYLNDALFADGSQYWGLYMKGPVGDYRLRGYNWGGGDKFVEVPIQTNQYYLTTWWLGGSSMTLQLYQGASNTISGVGKLDYLDGTPDIGRTSGSLYMDGDVAEVLVYNRTLSEAERGQVQQHLYGKWFKAVSLPPGTLLRIR